MSKYSEWIKSNYAAGTLRVSHNPSTYIDDVAYFTVEPYFAGMSLYWAFKADPELFRHEAAGWLTWWFNNRNAATGSCLVHYCTADRSVLTTKAGELPENKEDATDSNIAMWYLLLDAFTSRYGADAFTAEFKAALHEPLLALFKLYEPDGLTWAKQDYKVKYLMDNVEVVAGLTAAESVISAFGPQKLGWRLAQFARDLRQQTALSVESLRDKRRRCWNVSEVYDGSKTAPDMTKAYPDLNCQVWPSIFGVGTNDGLSIVERHYPNWARERISNDTMTDVHIVTAAKVAGRNEDVKAWLANVAPSYEDDGRFKWPFTVAEAGMLHYVTTA